MQAEVRYKELYSKKSFLKLNMPMPKSISSAANGEDSFSVVILRSPANGATRKNFVVPRFGGGLLAELTPSTSSGQALSKPKDSE